MGESTVFDPFTLLQQVDAFYQTSWNHLILYTGVAIGIVGIVIPVLIQLYQSRVIRLEKEELKAFVQAEVTRETTKAAEQEHKRIDETLHAKWEILEGLMAQDREEMKKLLNEKVENLKRTISRTNGSIFFVLCHHLIKSGNYGPVVGSALDAIDSYIAGDDHLNLRRLLEFIKEECLPHLIKDNFLSDDNLQKRFENTLADIQTWDKHNDFSDLLTAVRRAFKTALERTTRVATG